MHEVSVGWFVSNTLEEFSDFKTLGTVQLT